MDNSWDFLHISDLHLTSANEYLDDNKAKVRREYRESGLRNFLHLHDTSPTLQSVANVVLSGDVTQAGGEDGFLQFTNDVLPRLRAQSRRFFAVPGNHDVAWGLKPHAADYFTKKFAFFRKHVQGDDLTVSLFPEANWEKDRKFVSGNPIFVDQEKGFMVLCINSSLRCGEVDGVTRTDLEKRLKPAEKELTDAGKLTVAAGVREARNFISEITLRDVAHVTQEQRVHLSKLLHQEQQKLGAKWHQMLRVAVLHHHLMPFKHQVTEHKAFEPVSDAAQILSMLEEFDFHLIFTGHKHQSYQAHYHGTKREMLIMGGRTVCGRGDLGCKLVRVRREDSDFIVKIADLDTAHEHPYGEEAVKEALTRASQSFYRVVVPHRTTNPTGFPDSPSLKALTSERDELRRCILQILNPEFSLEHWELTYEIGTDGRDVFSQIFDIVAKNAPVSLFLQRISRIDGPLLWTPELPAWDHTDPGSPRKLSSCVVERTDRDVLFAIILAPASKRGFPRRISTSCEREGFWVPLWREKVDEGYMQLQRKVTKMTYCFVAPPGLKWKAFEPIPSIGEYYIEQEETKIRWELKNLTPGRLRYRLFLQ